MSILELMVAMTVFAIVIGAATMGLSGTLNLVRNNRSRSVAANLAAQDMDIVRSTPFASLPLGLYVTTQVVDKVQYRIQRYSRWVSKVGTAGPCDGTSGQQLAFVRVTTFVGWDNRKGVGQIKTQTIVAAPFGSYDPNSGHVSVVVRDRDAAPEAGVPVTVNGPSGSQSQATDDEGCAFFAYLIAGTYTVTLSGPGYVDGQGVATPVVNAAVSNGNTTSIQFDYDLAATLSLTLQSPAGGAIPATVTLSVGNSHLVPTGTKGYTGQSGLVRTIGNNFPYTDGYTSWAGTCLDSDPQGQKPSGGGPYYPGALRDAPVSVTPAGTSNGVVNLPSIRLRVLKNGAPVAGQTLTATHATDNGCSGGLSYTIPGTTDSSGYVWAGLPFGLWTFQVTGKSPKTSWPTSTLAPPAGSTAYQLDVNIL
jgi:type II secretory pathway pseudopilin PulG